MTFVANNFSVIDRRSGLDRRKRHLPIFSKYWLTGKRAVVRRKEDRKRPYRIDRHSARTGIAVILIVTLSVIDAVLTLDLVSRGATELNPIMAYYLGRSPLAFFSVKYLLTWAGVVLILLNKSSYLFNTKIQVKILFIIFIIPFVLVVQWELYLLFSNGFLD
jgi:hypothetical protein